MTAALQVIWTILLSMGLSVTADMAGDTLSTIYQNQTPEVQQRLDTVMFHPDVALSLGALELTADAYAYCQGWNPDDPSSWKLSNAVVQESVGIENWQNIIAQNQSNVVPAIGGGVRQFTFSGGQTLVLDIGVKSGGATNGWYEVDYYLYDSDGNLITDGNPTGYSIMHQDREKVLDAINKFVMHDDGTLDLYSALSGKYVSVNIPYQYERLCGVSGLADPEASDPVLSVGTVGDYPINPDGSITLPDGTLVYPNTDGSYTIDGKTYSPEYDLGSYNDTALASILEALLSSTASSDSSSESVNYTGILGNILNAINNFRSSVTSSSSAVKSKLSDILSAVKALPTSISSAIASDLAISDEVKNKAMEELKEKLGYSALQSSVNVVSTTFFGERTFNDNGEVVIDPVFDTGETVTVKRPHLYFTLFNKQYDLFSGLYMFDSAVNIFKSLVSFFLIVAFLVGFFRSLPSLLISVAEVKSIESPAVITNTFSNFDIYQTPNNNKPPKPPKPSKTKANGKGG